MNRRMFSQLMAFGAGLISSPAGWAGQANAAESDDAAPAANPDAPWKSPPVTVEDFIPLAEAKLPKATFDYITTGSEEQVTLKDNVEAFRRIQVVPPLLHGVQSADLSTTVLGQKIDLPVLIAPVAALRMYHPQGALAVARAAEKAGTIFCPSTSAYNSVEEIAAASSGPKWFQMYVPRDRNIARKLVNRAEKSGYKALVVTVDLGERKDADLRNRFRPPQDMLVKHLRDVGHTQVTGRETYDELLAFNSNAWDISLSWDFFKWLREVTELPIIVKGVLSQPAAEEAFKLVDGIIVSNHGGRRLDGMPASIDVLADVAATVRTLEEREGRKITLLLDSGVRRGGDVLRALALGADAVLIGRPHAWALAAAGEAGVTRVLNILHDELTTAMVAAGCATVDDIDYRVFKGNTDSGAVR